MNKNDALKRAAELRQLANRLHRLEIDCVVRARELEQGLKTTRKTGV